MNQIESSAPDDLPLFVELDAETQTPVVAMTKLPEGLLARLIALKDEKLPSSDPAWYKLSQASKALKFARLGAASGNNEEAQVAEDESRWKKPMPADWQEFIEQGNPDQPPTVEAPRMGHSHGPMVM